VKRRKREKEKPKPLDIDNWWITSTVLKYDVNDDSSVFFNDAAVSTAQG